MTKDTNEYVEGGVLRDQFGRRQMTLRGLHQARSVGDAFEGGTIVDSDKREQIVLRDGNGNVMTSASGGMPPGWVDVTANGAIGNNTADDTAAIQAVINTVKAVGGVVYFPPNKTFKITSTLTCNDNGRPIAFWGGSGASWGELNDTTPTLNYTGTTGSLLQCHSAIQVALMGLRFVYTNALYKGAGTYLVDFDWGVSSADCQLNKIMNCSFNASGIIVTPSNGAQALLRLSKFIIGEVFNCHFGAAQEGIRMGDPASGQYIVTVQVRNCTYNFAQSAHIMIGSGDAEMVTIGPGNNFEGCPANGAIYGNGAGPYNLQIVDNWFGDSDAAAAEAWINNLAPTSNNFVGTIQGNRFAGNPWAFNISGAWLVIGNTVETGHIYKNRSSAFGLTDIGNFYNVVGANVFEAGAPPQAYNTMGSSSNDGAMVNSTAAMHPSLLIGRQGATSGFNSAQLADLNTQIGIGCSGFDGGGVIASANKALIYTDYLNANNKPNLLRIQAPGAATTAEVQLIAGTSAPAPLVRCSETKLAFYNVAPVSRPTAYTQTYSTAARTHNNVTSVSVATTAATNAAPFGYSTGAQADAIPVAINAVEADLLNLKQLVNSVIDDMQANGLMQ